MLRMKLYTRLYYVLLMWCCMTATAFAQRYERQLEEAEKHYDDGNYDKSLDKIEKAISIAQRKDKGFVLAYLQIYQAKYLLALARYTEFEDILRQALANKKVKGESSLMYGAGLLEAAHLYLDYSDVRTAETYLEQARNILERRSFTGVASAAENPDDDLYFKTMLLYLEARVALEKGHFDAFSKYYPELKELTDKRIENRERYYDQATGTFDEHRLLPSQVKRRKRMYAEVLTMQGRIYRKQGHYAKAEESLGEAEAWIQSKIGNKDLAFIANRHEQTLLAIDKGTDRKTLTKMIQRNLFLAERRLGMSHHYYTKIHETLIDLYARAQFRSKNNKQLWEMDVNTGKFYGKKRLPHVTFEITEAKNSYYNQAYRFARRTLENLHQNTDLLPTNHQERLKLLKLLYEVCITSDDYADAQQYLQEYVETTKGIFGPDALAYHQAQMDLVHYYLNYSNKTEAVKPILETSYYPVITKQMAPSHKLFARQYWGDLIEYYELNEQYDSAQSIAKTLLAVQRKEYGYDHPEYAMSLEKVVRLEMDLGEYRTAESQVDTMLTTFKTQYDRRLQSLDMSKVLETSGRYYTHIGLFEEAKFNLSRANRLYRRNPVSLTSASISDAMADMQLKVENFAAAERLLDQTIELRKKNYGEDSRFLIPPYNDLAELLFVEGDYIKAEEYINKANQIAVSTYGEKSSKVVESLLIKANIANGVGNYDEAEESLNNALNILKGNKIQNQLQIAEIYSSLALTKLYKTGNLDAASRLLKEALESVERSLGIQNPIYAEVVEKLALVRIEEARYSDALKDLKLANSIWATQLGTELNTKSASIELLIGDAHLRQGNTSEAIYHYSKARTDYAAIFNKNHPGYIEALGRLGRAYFAEGNYKLSMRYMNEAIKKHNTYITNFFSSLSESGKAKYWAKIRPDYEFYNNLAVVAGRKALRKSFDNSLATKGLLLSASQKIRNSILSSGDSALIATFNRWVSLKDELAEALSLSNEAQKEEGLDPNKITKEIEKLEKELSARSGLFASSSSEKPMTWKRLRKALLPGEAAVEIVRYRRFDKAFTDTAIYVAMIVSRKNRKGPQIIEIPNGNLLEDRNFRYFRSCFEAQVEDDLSYDAYWKPLAEHLEGFDRIFISGEGVYNQINLEAIPYKEGKYLIDLYNISLVSNTKDIITSREAKTEAETAKNIALVGNPLFYKDVSEEEQRGENNNRMIKQLPGTATELSRISELASQANIQMTLLTKELAQEEEIRRLESPGVLHIATHGFFAPDEAVTGAAAELNREAKVSNPLLRSGLLFSNAGELIDGNPNVYSYNKEGGVLTAFEAQSLKLDNTELVILSACETARGDVKVGEGVYGLQRALLVAGSKAVIMSLFKVDDTATQLLMTYFYENWQTKKMDKRQAFLEAKKRLRQEYPDPIFWGAFILIGSV